jgi:hypothetical protein
LLCNQSSVKNLEEAISHDAINNSSIDSEWLRTAMTLKQRLNSEDEA